jgi:3-deoxy-D-arabino-heptulosonate 7-phosphate (DAHP) synthase
LKWIIDNYDTRVKDVYYNSRQNGIDAIIPDVQLSGQDCISVSVSSVTIFTEPTLKELQYHANVTIICRRRRLPVVVPSVASAGERAVVPSSLPAASQAKATRLSTNVGNAQEDPLKDSSQDSRVTVTTSSKTSGASRTIRCYQS